MKHQSLLKVGLCLSFLFAWIIGKTQDLEITLTPSNFHGYNISCYGSHDGRIDLSITGGTPPYAFKWSTGSDIEDLTHLVAGYYHVSVTDANGGVLEGEITLTQPDALGISGTVYVYSNGYNNSCYQCSNGEVDLSIAGGVAPFSFIWTDENTGQSRYNLGPGSYRVDVTDNNGCETRSEYYSITGPPKSNWAMDGNSGSNPTTQFMGTTDNKDFVFRTNNTERLRLQSNGLLDAKAGIKLSNMTGSENRVLYIDQNGVVNSSLSGDDISCGQTIPSTWYKGATGNGDIVRYCGKVGIGTVSPSVKLDVVGDVKISSLSSDGSGIVTANSNGVLGKTSYGSATHVLLGNGTFGPVPSSGSASYWSLNGTNLSIANSNLNVGVGTSPSEKLDVNGNLKVSGNILTNSASSAMNLHDLHVNNRIEVGNSIWLGGTNSGSATNDIYTDDADLIINGNSSFSYNTILNTNSGKVGIGTPTPSSKLTIKDGEINVTKTTGDWTSSHWKTVLTSDVGSAWRMTGTTTSGGLYLGFGMTSTGWYWTSSTSTDASQPAGYPMRLILDSSQPSGWLLCTSGGFRCATLRVTASGCDYVFANEYQRMSWKRKEDYYLVNKHLPLIDAASITESEGLDVAKNFTGMLQNLEEDRLDITDLFKKIENLERLNTELQKQIDELKGK